jgi:hypothetical protein
MHQPPWISHSRPSDAGGGKLILGRQPCHYALDLTVVRENGAKKLPALQKHGELALFKLQAIEGAAAIPLETAATAGDLSADFAADFEDAFVNRNLRLGCATIYRRANRNHVAPLKAVCLLSERFGDGISILDRACELENWSSKEVELIGRFAQGRNGALIN